MLRRGLILLLIVQTGLIGWPVALTLPTITAAAPAAVTHACSCCPVGLCQCCPKESDGAAEEPATDGKPVLRQCRCGKHHALLLTSTQVLPTTSAPVNSSVELPPAGKVIAEREHCESLNLPPDPPPPRLGK